MRSGSPTKEAGFTLMELIVVIIVVGILSAYAIMKNGSSGVFSLLSQAQTMASDIKHAQTLATVWGKRLRINSADGGYTVMTCVGADEVSPCDVLSPAINPATGTAFNVALEKGVTLAGPHVPLDITSLGQPVITSLGQPVAAASYTLSINGTSIRVVVAAVTGHVSVVIP